MSFIAITGAAGFIGSNLVRKLNSLGFNNLILVDSLQQFSKTWEYSLKNINYSHIFEINDYIKYLSKLENHPDYTFHIGAISDTIGHPSIDYFKYNYKYTKILLDKFSNYINNTLKVAYFINASSSAVYGNGNGPLNTYAMCKLMIDNYILQNHSLFNNYIASCRFFNVYGINEFHKGNMASMIFKLINEGINNNTFTIFEPGEQKRDFIYVKDLINNIINIFPLLSNDQKGLFNKYNTVEKLKNPIIDFGTGSNHSFNDIVKTIQKIIGLKKSIINYIRMPDNIQKTYQVLTKSNLHLEYPLKIKYSLSDGIIDYCKLLNIL